MPKASAGTSHWFPCQHHWQHLPLCSLSATLSRVSSRDTWHLQPWPEGPVSWFWPPALWQSYLAGDPASSRSQSCSSAGKGRNWVIGSISTAGSIHSSFLWNPALYLSLRLHCFFRNSISEAVRWFMWNNVLGLHLWDGVYLPVICSNPNTRLIITIHATLCYNNSRKQGQVRKNFPGGSWVEDAHGTFHFTESIFSYLNY